MYGGELVAGGNFTHAGGIEVRRIARWNGQNWLRLEGVGGYGVGVAPGQHPQSLAASAKGLYVGGFFDVVSGVTVNKIALWHPVNGWSALADNDGFGLGRNAVAYSLQAVGDTLIVGGQFGRAGEKAAWNLAYWHYLDSDRIFRDRFASEPSALGDFLADSGSAGAQFRTGKP